MHGGSKECYTEVLRLAIFTAALPRQGPDNYEKQGHVNWRLCIKI